MGFNCFGSRLLPFVLLSVFVCIFKSTNFYFFKGADSRKQKLFCQNNHFQWLTDGNINDFS